MILQSHFKLAQLSYSEIRRHDAISYIHPTVCGMYRFIVQGFGIGKRNRFTSPVNDTYPASFRFPPLFHDGRIQAI